MKTVLKLSTLFALLSASLAATEVTILTRNSEIVPAPIVEPHIAPHVKEGHHHDNNDEHHQKGGRVVGENIVHHEEYVPKPALTVSGAEELPHKEQPEVINIAAEAPTIKQEPTAADIAKDKPLAIEKTTIAKEQHQEPTAVVEEKHSTHEEEPDKKVIAEFAVKEEKPFEAGEKSKEAVPRQNPIVVLPEQPQETTVGKPVEVVQLQPQDVKQEPLQSEPVAHLKETDKPVTGLQEKPLEAQVEQPATNVVKAVKPETVEHKKAQEQSVVREFKPVNYVLPVKGQLTILKDGHGIIVKSREGVAHVYHIAGKHNKHHEVKLVNKDVSAGQLVGHHAQGWLVEASQDGKNLFRHYLHATEDKELISKVENIPLVHGLQQHGKVDLGLFDLMGPYVAYTTVSKRGPCIKIILTHSVHIQTHKLRTALTWLIPAVKSHPERARQVLGLKFLETQNQDGHLHLAILFSNKLVVLNVYSGEAKDIPLPQYLRELRKQQRGNVHHVAINFSVDKALQRLYGLVQVDGKCSVYSGKRLTADGKIIHESEPHPIDLNLEHGAIAGVYGDSATLVVAAPKKDLEEEGTLVQVYKLRESKN